MNPGAPSPFLALRLLLELEARRWAASPTWVFVLIGAGFATVPLSLSPYIPGLLPAMACGLLAAESEFMDMLRARKRDYLRFAALPLRTRDLILGKGIFAMAKATAGMVLVTTLHLWFMSTRPTAEQTVAAMLGFVGTLPLLAQVGASASLQAVRTPSTGILDPLARSAMLLLAALACGLPAGVIFLVSASWSVLLLYAAAALAVWWFHGTSATARAVERWNHSEEYNI
jgi:hypothetical protein